MIGTKEADLVTAVLLYAMRCLAEGDQHALRAMRFGPREIEALRELNLADLYRVGALQAHCLSIALDREVFWPMVANLQATREVEELQRDLIQADAPLEMMRSLFGVGSREYTRLRRMLAVDPAVGRPPEPDEETGHRLWRALSARLESIGEEALDPKEYLAVQQCTFRRTRRRRRRPRRRRISAPLAANGSDRTIAWRKMTRKSARRPTPSTP